MQITLAFRYKLGHSLLEMVTNCKKIEERGRATTATATRVKNATEEKQTKLPD